MPGTPSWLRRLASFLARLFRFGPAPSTVQPSLLSGRLAEIRATLTPEERTLLFLRLERGLSWQEVAEVLAERGQPPRAAEARDRFEKIKERLRWMAEAKGRGPSAASAEAAPYGQLAVAEVARLVGDAGARLFDLRSPEAYARGHVPGAVRAAPGDVVRSLPADRALHLVYYGENTRDPACHGAARAAAQAGYPNVFIMPAGIDGWRAAGKRVEMES